MSEPFVGEIRMFAGNFAPRGWAFCDGQLLAVSQNDALFSLFGTIYGGDGRTTFGLPDMRGRIPLHQGTGPGLSPRRLGAKGGEENVTLTVNQLTSHSHDLNASKQSANQASPTGRVLATGVGVRFYREQAQDVDMASTMVANTGGSRSHTNLMPALCVNFIVSLFGIYPSRH
ncbi:MAG: tail fiber protein [Pseudomonadota bacterium]|nr:tail fiber protein [Pseudomonadota bacterium]